MGPQDPRLSSPAERERSAAQDKGTGGQIFAVCSVSTSPLTHNPFVTLLQPFRIKCERYIFLKKCVCSSLLLSLLPHVYVYSCICITAMQQCYPLFTSSSEFFWLWPAPLNLTRVQPTIKNLQYVVTNWLEALQLTTEKAQVKHKINIHSLIK